MNYPIISPDTSFDAVILCAGDYPSYHIPLEILQKNRFLCCCDGAAVAAEERSLHIDAIVGDGDSLTREFKESHSDILHIVSEQEYNDQTKATHFCVEKGFRRIAYLGCTGKREDHTLGNISLMAMYARTMGIMPVMISDYGYFIAATGRNTFDTFARQQVSVFNISCTSLSSEGLLWNVYPFNEWWQGTENEAAANSICIDGDGWYIVFLTHERKY